MTRGGRVVSETFSGSRGNAGNVTLQEVDTLVLRDAAQISGTTAGRGRGGNLTITAHALIDIYPRPLHKPQPCCLNAVPSACKASRSAPLSWPGVLAGRDSVPAQPGGTLPSPLPAEGARSAQTSKNSVREQGILVFHPRQLDMDASGQARVQGWPVHSPVHSMVLLGLDAACAGWAGTQRFPD